MKKDDSTPSARRNYRLRAESVLPCNDIAGGSGVSGVAGDSSRLVNGAISSREKRELLEFFWSKAPIVGVRLMKNDAIIVRKARNPDELAERLEGAVRGKIEYLSRKSRRRLALVAGNSPITMRSFITVTYPNDFPCDGTLVKLHLNRLIKRLSRKCGKIEYLWFLEFQAREAPHFHMFLDYDLPGPLVPMTRKTSRLGKTVQINREHQDWISSAWYEIVGSGDIKHLHAGSAWEKIEKPDGCARYVAKEAYKTFQKQVPLAYQNVGRFWGCSKGVTPDEPKIDYCSVAKMRKLFPPECFDEEGQPFPIMFGGAHALKESGQTITPKRKARTIDPFDSLLDQSTSRKRK